MRKILRTPLFCAKMLVVFLGGGLWKTHSWLMEDACSLDVEYFWMAVAFVIPHFKLDSRQI